MLVAYSNANADGYVAYLVDQNETTRTVKIMKVRLTGKSLGEIGIDGRERHRLVSCDGRVRFPEVSLNSFVQENEG